MKKRIERISFLIVISFLISCSCGERNKPAIITPEKFEKVNIKIKRYEKDLFNIDKTNLQSELKRIKPEYSFFLDGDLNDKKNIEQISSYLSDPQIIKNFNEVDKQFKDLTFLERDLSNALSLYMYYYPEKRIPVVYTYVCGMDFERPVIFADSVMLIALDMFLGPDYSLYNGYGLPLFIRKNMSKEYIVKKCVEAIAAYNYYQDLKDATCLDNMIYYGKIQLFTEALLPKTEDSIKMEYSAKQLEWCKNNEGKMWAFFIDNKLLFSTNKTDYSKFFSPAPFTSAFSKESPPKTGVWLGWQIMRKYAQQVNSGDLKIIFQENDAQKILNISKYKPAKND
jgi:hypothetical protein